MGGFKDPATNHCYFIVNNSEPWSTANEKCVDTGPGTTLASFSLEAEFTLVVVDEMPPENYWIGGHDQNVEGTFEWLSGEPWTFVDSTYPWAAGQPQIGDGQDCVRVGFVNAGDPQRIRDRDCSVSLDALCERVPIEGPAS